MAALVSAAAPQLRLGDHHPAVELAHHEAQAKLYRSEHSELQLLSRKPLLPAWPSGTVVHTSTRKPSSSKTCTLFKITLPLRKLVGVTAKLLSIQCNAITSPVKARLPSSEAVSRARRAALVFILLRALKPKINGELSTSNTHVSSDLSQEPACQGSESWTLLT